MSVLPAVVLGVVGVLVGTLANRAAGRYPWPESPRIGQLVERG
ncbi:hypothetical protein [Blastococcus brunescens]|uniref:Uncharacterized protein n=1 Tax=Blastococcus brunescens TaxID=1564165 RepID=A0ABZ1B9P9_9ACTN|nr:hypothetical protein [Blastococcus sp. BMG 8361]WRL65830.1 hypothetical protein U6N30_09835 [Blastococcus sp. BMG 8361]